MQPGDKVAFYGDFEPGPYNFYTGIVPIPVLEKEEALSEFLRSQERVFCLTKLRDLLKFQLAEGAPEFRLIARRGGKDNDIVLLSNR
jgi:hypothetical protein